MDTQSGAESTARDRLEALRASYPNVDYSPFEYGLLGGELNDEQVITLMVVYTQWSEYWRIYKHDNSKLDDLSSDAQFASRYNSEMTIDLAYDSHGEVTLSTNWYHEHLDLNEVIDEVAALVKEEKVLVAQFRGERLRSSWLAPPDDVSRVAEDSFSVQPLGCAVFLKPIGPTILKVRSWKGTYNRDIEL